jgi:sporulation protein YlmC with PRC-barrel domain
MRVELGTHVRTSDGKDVGVLDKLILDPRTDEIKAVVIRKGLILHRDIEVPLTAVQAGPQGDLHLTYAADQVAELPAFMESNYTEPPTHYEPPTGYLAGGGVLWPIGSVPEAAPPSQGYDAGPPTDQHPTTMLTQQDVENAVIGVGSEVWSRDGHKVGSLHQLTFDEATGHLVRFVVRVGGLLTPEDLELPASLITGVQTKALFLRVDAAQVTTWSHLIEGLEVWTSDGVYIGGITRRTAEYFDVTGPEHAHYLRVPLSTDLRVEGPRAILAADVAQAARWEVPSGSAPAPSS